MILFYDFKTLNNKYAKQPRKFLDNVLNNSTAKEGQDFIINGDIILKNPLGLQLKDIILYMELCSHRTFYEYKLNGTVDIPIYYLDEPDRFNPLKGKLFTISNNIIVLLKEKL